MKHKVTRILYLIGLYLLLNSQEIIWMEPLYRKGGVYDICKLKFHFHPNFIYPPDMD